MDDFKNKRLPLYPTSLLLLYAIILNFGCADRAATQVSSPSRPPPNIIFIYADNLGYGDIEPFGAKSINTPQLNRMAAEGRKFTHFCVTAGVCTPSRASAMTGCYAQRVGMHLNERDIHVLRPISLYGLNPEEITVAEILKESGYATACIGKWHLGDQPPFLPTRQGFDSYFGIPYSDDMTARTWEPDVSYQQFPINKSTFSLPSESNRNN